MLKFLTDPFRAPPADSIAAQCALAAVVMLLVFAATRGLGAILISVGLYGAALGINILHRNSGSSD